MKKAVTLPDGHYYQMPNAAQDNHGYVGNKAWIYKPWLDKLGLALPVTTDDFYNVLRPSRPRTPTETARRMRSP